MSDRDRAEEYLRAAESGLGRSDDDYLLHAVVGLGYAVLAALEGQEASRVPSSIGDVIGRGNREEFINNLVALFADTIRNDVRPGTRTALVMRFDRSLRDKLGW